MSKEVITLKPTDTYQVAAKLLVDKAISGFPVVDEAGKLVGILSEKDLIRVLYPFYQSFYKHPELYLDLEEREGKIKEILNDPISNFMTTEVVSCGPDMPIMEAAAIMLVKSVHRLPVIEDGQLVGIITRQDVYHQVFKHYAS